MTQRPLARDHLRRAERGLAPRRDIAAARIPDPPTADAHVGAAGAGEK